MPQIGHSCIELGAGVACCWGRDGGGAGVRAGVRLSFSFMYAVSISACILLAMSKSLSICSCILLSVSSSFLAMNAVNSSGEFDF